MDSLLQPMTLILLYFIHALIVIVLSRLLKRIVDQNHHGVMTWIAIVSCFLPLIGELFGVISWLLAKRWVSDKMLVDYGEYVTFDVLNLESLRHEAATSLDLVPLTEALNDHEHTTRKDLIVRLINSNITNQGKYLNLGLNNSDSETVHYAAATMNILLDRYEKELQKAKDLYRLHDESSFLKVVDVYERYLKSGLLEDSSLRNVQKEYAILLENETKSPTNDKQRYLYLGDLYLEMGYEEKAIETYTYITEAFRNEPDGYLKLIEYYYGKRSWTMIRPLLNAIEKYVPESKIPDKQHFVLKQLGGNEE
ncbi:hypothetical protein [Guptibacillus hwajinpoensis]|uniref:hypothetical protein n=1 Tax=Guptibacillus hwajinpoensis TaxID=208199 RepID=UPI003D08F03C